MSKESAGLRVLKLNINNFMRIEALEINAQGDHVIIKGPNASGKTSAIDALWSALGGGRARKIDKPIRDGQKKATVCVDVGEFKVEKSWTASGTRLKVTAADGSQVKNAQTILDGLFDVFALDPLKFLQLTPKEQIFEVLSVAGVTPPVNAVRKITGQDHYAPEGESANDYLVRLGGDSGHYYIERRTVGREVTSKREALAEAKESLEGMGAAPEEAVSPSALIEQLQGLQLLERDREKACQRKEDAERSLLMSRENFANNQAELKNLESQVKRLSLEVGEWREDVQDCKDTVKASSAVYDLMPNPSDQIEELRDKLAQAETQGSDQIMRQAKVNEVARLTKEHAKSESEHQRLDTILESLRGLQAGLLDGVDLGIKGLSVGDGPQLFLGNNPLSQASHAERISTSCAIGCAKNPQLRVLRVDDGEHLDKKTRKALFAAAKSKGFQVFMTCVNDAEDLGVEIVNGEG